MKLKLERITFFVEDVEKATRVYKDLLGMTPADIRRGWSAFRVSSNFEIAFHHGKGRKPRLGFTTSQNLAMAREQLNKGGARLGPLKKLIGKSICMGKDADGNIIQLSNS